jgi:cytochrome c heme-lyase
MSSNDSSCPYKASPKSAPTKPDAPAVYNVYNERIDPNNMMPATANQAPWPGQKEPISVHREQSQIPKGGTDTTWLFPSPQMFYNSLHRKDKGDDVSERDAGLLVHIHNNMNNFTWKKVAEWEKEFHSDCQDPRLLRFVGRPHDLSPKARFLMFRGETEPFDRHDWFVDRCGKEHRYIIDFYHNDQPNNATEGGLVRSNIWLDARPALDSFSAFVDRAKSIFNKGFKNDKVANTLTYPQYDPSKYAPTGQDFTAPSTTSKTLGEGCPVAQRSSTPAKSGVTDNEKKFSRASEACASELSTFAKCSNQAILSGSEDAEAVCKREYTDVILCMGQQLCVDKTKAFLDLAKNPNSSNEDIFSSLQRIEETVKSFSQPR